MHATIAGFSSGVPTLGLGYSHKAQGVFDECGIGAHVADLRAMDAAEIWARVAASVAERDRMKAELAVLLPDVKARANVQMDALGAMIRSLGG